MEEPISRNDYPALLAVTMGWWTVGSGVHLKLKDKTSYVRERHTDKAEQIVEMRWQEALPLDIDQPASLPLDIDQPAPTRADLLTSSNSRTLARDRGIYWLGRKSTKTVS